MAWDLVSRVRRVCVVTLIAAGVMTGAAHTSHAQDFATAKHEVLSSPDVRVKVAAVLWLGRTKPHGARELLEQALDDAQPTVRSAAAAALNSLGDPRAIPALEHAAADENIDAVRAQMNRAASALHDKQSEGTRYVVQLGTMRNSTRVRGPAMESVLRTAVASRAGAIPGVVVADVHSASRLANERQVPLLILDGNLTGLTQARAGTNMTVHAQVQFLVRRESTLKASMTGSATAEDSMALSNAQRVAALENDAVDGAVQSAMRGADTGLALAAR